MRKTKTDLPSPDKGDKLIGRNVLFRPHRAKPKKPAARPNYRRELEASLEREQQWKTKLEEAEKLVERLQGYGCDMSDVLDRHRYTNQTLRAQVDALRAHLNALMQRYVGVKIDTQQFTFVRAQQWLEAEGEAIAATLNRVAAEAQRNQGERQEEAA